MKRIVILTEGEYSDFSIESVLLVPRDVDLAAARATWEKANPAPPRPRDWGAAYAIGSMRATSWREYLLALPGVEVAPHEEIHACAFCEKDVLRGPPTTTP